MSTSSSLAGKVLQGTCGWSDFKLPGGHSKATTDRLSHYARFFPCVEVDTSCYAIPSPQHTAKWIKSVLSIHPGFTFHFKAFGLFCHQSAPINTLPWQARQVLRDAGLLPPQGPSSAPTRTTIGLSDMPPGCEQACWDAFHVALEPMVQAKVMGSVVFQFQLNFSPSPRHREYVERCRRMLRGDVVMAVEFRDRAWFKDPAAMADLVAWCSGLGLCLVAADELRHETFQKDRAQTGLPAGQVRELLPTCLAATRPDMTLVRLHRRHGTTDRLLLPEEHQAWAQRLASVAPSLTGPIFFLWGTDWEDAPVINSRALAAALPPMMRYDHEAITAEAIAARPGTINSMFSRKGASQGNGASGRVSGNAASASQPLSDGLPATQSNASAQCTTPSLDSLGQENPGPEGKQAGAQPSTHGNAVEGTDAMEGGCVTHQKGRPLLAGHKRAVPDSELGVDQTVGGMPTMKLEAHNSSNGHACGTPRLGMQGSSSCKGQIGIESMENLLDMPCASKQPPAEVALGGNRSTCSVQGPEGHARDVQGSEAHVSSGQGPSKQTEAATGQGQAASTKVGPDKGKGGTVLAPKAMVSAKQKGAKGLSSSKTKTLDIRRFFDAQS